MRESPIRLHLGPRLQIFIYQRFADTDSLQIRKIMRICIGKWTSPRGSASASGRVHSPQVDESTWICICKWTSPQSAHFWLASVWHRSSELVSNSELTRSHGRHGYVTSHTGQLSHLSITALAMSSAICNWITLVRKVTAERRGPPPVAMTIVCSLRLKTTETEMDHCYLKR